MVRILLETDIKKKDLPDCFGTCLGGTECWEACGDGNSRYVKCLLQGKALIDEALESELLQEEAGVWAK